MSVLSRIAYFQGRHDEVPNQELARELAYTKDQQDIQEIAQNLWNENRSIQSDCLKVLYEIGYLEPQLIADYAADFLKLLESKQNRLVWGSMIALSTLAPIRAGELFPYVADIKRAMEQGSVITRDNGVKVLAGIASAQDRYRQAIFPYLARHLETCRAKDVPQHAESVLVAVNAAARDEFVRVLEKRLPEMSSSQASRLKKVIRATEILAGE
jgi:hypothetical protein